MNNEEILSLEKEKTHYLSIHFYFMIKRLFDILVGIFGMFFLVPLFLFIKIIYVLSGDFSPIMFKHKRIGKNGEEFNMYKFRTMVPNASEILKELLKDKNIKKEWEENHKLDNDPRITKIGRILRKTSIDEFPQFINVFNGEMSLIGPRPLVQDEVDAYKKNKEKLLSIKPGITGYWACNGRSCTSNKKRQNLELYYVDNCSISLDVKIFFKTIIKVIQKEGAK